MNFKRQVNVTFGKNPIVDGEAFLFEVAPSDVPYGIYGRDCVQIAQVVGQGAIPFCRKRDGKLGTVLIYGSQLPMQKVPPRP